MEYNVMRALFTQHKNNKEEKWVIFCAFVLCLSLLSRFPRSLLSLSPLKRSETQRKSTGNKTWKQRLGYCVLLFTWLQMSVKECVNQVKGRKKKNHAFVLCFSSLHLFFSCFHFISLQKNKCKGKPKDKDKSPIS